MPDLHPTKAELRSALRARRRAFVAGLEPEEHDAAFGTLPRRLWPLVAPARTVGLYRASGVEAPTEALIHYMLDSRRAVALPRMDDGRLTFALWSPGDRLETVEPGFEQPGSDAERVTPDLVLAPLLGFDAELRRLGQGGGHYDRWSAVHPNVPLIGLAWSAQEVERVPVEPHDRPLDAVLTERAVLARAGART